MQIGYARVSAQDQNFDLQIDALRKAGCEKFFQDLVWDKWPGSISIRPVVHLMVASGPCPLWVATEVGPARGPAKPWIDHGGRPARDSACLQGCRQDHRLCHRPGERKRRGVFAN